MGHDNNKINLENKIITKVKDRLLLLHLVKNVSKTTY